jgi:hypothetical protein
VTPWLPRAIFQHQESTRASGADHATRAMESSTACVYDSRSWASVTEWLCLAAVAPFPQATWMLSVELRRVVHMTSLTQAGGGGGADPPAFFVASDVVMRGPPGSNSALTPPSFRNGSGFGGLGGPRSSLDRVEEEDERCALDCNLGDRRLRVELFASSAPAVPSLVSLHDSHPPLVFRRLTQADLFFGRLDDPCGGGRLDGAAWPAGAPRWLSKRPWTLALGTPHRRPAERVPRQHR